MWWLVLVMITMGCADDPQCHQPAQNEYDCQPATGSQGCQGGPKNNVLHPEDLEKVFPESCFVTIPDCGRLGARQFRCECAGSACGWAEQL